MTLVVLQDGPLCQQGPHSCAACCGLYNFGDRSKPAMAARLDRRTALVTQAGWDAHALAHARDTLQDEEAPLVLFKAVRTCAFAGWLDANHTRVGCLIHPARHPAGSDLRDLGAYQDRAICDGHLCAPHTWLTAVDRAFLAHAPDWQAYSMAVGESGFGKAVLRWVANARGGEVHAANLQRQEAAAPARALLQLLTAWPFVDPDPRRFGGFSFAGDDAYTRLVPSAARFSAVTPVEATILDALGTLVEDEDTAQRAVVLLRQHLQALADALPI